MWVALASILMLFIALTSAYIVRGVPALGGGESDWRPLEMPRVLWLTTGVLLLSSLSIELARRALKRNEYGAFKKWISITTLFGVAFLAGQLLAWQQLTAQGVYINSHPHSSFFYLLTSLHGVHLLGGVIALGYVTVAALRMRIGLKRRAAVDVTAIYWHFLLLVCAALLCATAFAKKPPQEWDGLTLVKLKGLDAAYARPGADFSIYNKIIIDPIQVAFAKGWDKEKPEKKNKDR